MNSLSILKNRQVGLFAVVAALLLAVILPVIASAAQLTERSISLSSSSANADDVTYTVNFTSDSGAGAFIVDFCTNTPLIGEDCDAPAGFSVSAATSATSGFTTVDAVDTNTVRVAGTIAAATAISVAIDNIDNPTASGALYARIVTYGTSGNAATYVDSTDLGTGVVDQGGAAISITDTIGVSGAVLESLTFCVAGNDNIGENCTPDVTLDGLTAPTLKLGEQVGDAFALVPGTVSEGSIYTQLSTNAASGAVVSLKSSTEGCGGLLRFGADPATECDIAPALTNGVSTSTAAFGVKTNAAVNAPGASDANGTYQAHSASGYNNSTYALNWVIGDASGVTSTFGDLFLDTNGAPVNNKNMAITFGASVTNQTPAGLYSADLSLIATGKF